MENESLKLIVIMKETFYAHYLPTVMKSWFFFFFPKMCTCMHMVNFFCTYKPGLLIRKQSYNTKSKTKKKLKVKLLVYRLATFKSNFG